MEYENSPYQTPQSAIESLANPDAVEVIPAGKWVRFFNYLIDYAGMMVLAFTVAVALGLLLGEEGIAYLDRIPNILFGMLLTLVYYLPLESLTGRTLGKLVTGTRVVNADGLKPSFNQILGRTFSRMVPFEPFSFLGAEGRGWHDTWPKTYVVKCR